LNEIRKILLFLVGSALLGALLAPWLWVGGQWLAETTNWKFVRDADFAQYFDRAVLSPRRCCCGRRCAACRSRTSSAGTRSRSRGWRHRGRIHCGVYLHGGVWRVVVEAGSLSAEDGPPPSALFTVTLSAATVALLEEWLFRGAVLGFSAARCSTGRPSSALGAVLHRAFHEAARGQRHRLALARVLPSCFAKFAEPALLLAGFSTLSRRLGAWLVSAADARVVAGDRPPHAQVFPNLALAS
jgi:hypothetical protein